MRSFLGTLVVNYIGTPYVSPIKLSGIAGVSIPLLFQWISYGAGSLQNIGVLVDCRNQACVKMDQIRSVYIDNMASDVPIYVQFLDTGYTVVAQPNSAGWYPVYTSDKYFVVYGMGFLTGDVPQTFIQITNIAIIPSIDLEIATSVDLWKASNNITRGNTIYNSNYGTPALGDQVQQFSGLFASGYVGVLVPALWSTPRFGGYIYLNNIEFDLIAPTVLGNGAVAIFLESTGISGVLYDFSYTFNPGGAAFTSATDVQTLLRMNNMNIKLDATQTWRLRVNANSAMAANYVLTMTFTTNPS